MKTQHTQEEWIIGADYPRHELSIVRKGEMYSGITPIAIIPKYNDSSLQEANAKLIASAPELLETLTAIMQMKFDTTYTGNSERYSKAKELAEQAIKKATE